MGAIEIMVSPEIYFKDKVASAIARQNITVNDHIEFYLVNLLCGFIDKTKVNSVFGEIDVMSTPLAILLKNAVEAPSTQKLKMFKSLGDTSLYMAGFFQDYFNRKAFDVGYYITLGMTAYGTVSTIMREQHNDDHFTGLYEELADNFEIFVEIVADVSDSAERRRPRDILALYDRWTKCNSDRLRRMLEEFGITPVQSNTKTRQ